MPVAMNVFAMIAPHFSGSNNGCSIGIVASAIGVKVELICLTQLYYYRTTLGTPKATTSLPIMLCMPKLVKSNILKP
jgi:hypothetical protein